MKTIKTYESFFKNLFKKKKINQEWSINKNITDEVRETLFDLMDNDDFLVFVGFNDHKYWNYTYCSFSYRDKPNYNVILIMIDKRMKTWQSDNNFTDSFYVNDIKDILEPAISYLNEVYGLKIDKIEYTNSRTSEVFSLIHHPNLRDVTEEIQHLKIFLK